MSFPVTRKHVFEAFLLPGDLSRWLAIDSVVEARKGGKYIFCLEPEDKNWLKRKRARVTFFRPDEMIQFSWDGPLHLSEVMSFADDRTTVKIHLVEEVKDGQPFTHLSLTHSGWKSSEDWQMAREWHVRFWERALGRLQAVLEQKNEKRTD